MYQLLCRGLAIAAGDRNKGNIELAAVVERKVLQGGQHVGYQQEPVVEPGRDLVDHGIGGAELERLAGKVIAIEAGALEGKEEIAGLQLPCVRPDCRMAKIDLVKLFDRGHRNVSKPGNCDAARR